MTTVEIHGALEIQRGITTTTSTPGVPPGHLVPARVL